MLTQANKQWANRPDDQRFANLLDLQAFVEASRAQSRAVVVPNRRLEVCPTEENQGLVVTGPNGHPYTLNNWSFGQLANLAGAHASYLRRLPAPLAADCINYGLHVERDVQELGCLIQRDEQDYTFRAATGPNYGRIWNSDVVRGLVDRFGDGITGQFRVPGEFGRAVEVTKRNTTLFASDRDLFVFLADEERRIEVPNRRNGTSGSMARGFFLWNSEVGSATFGIGMFLFDFVCANRIVWGAEQYQEIRIRHTSGAPHRFIEQAAPAIEAFVESSTSNISQTIAAAQVKKVSDLDAFLANRKFTGSQISGIKRAHQEEEGRPIESFWDVTTGVTAYAKTIRHQDERVSLERAGGKILTDAVA